MLVGSFTHLGHTLDLVVHDISNTFYINARTDEPSTVKFFDDGINMYEDIYQPTWRHTGILMTVGTSNITVQSFHEVDGEGKKHKNLINKDAFRELGSILRSLKNACTVKNRVDLDSKSSSYNAAKSYSYDIEGHTVVMHQGEVKELEYTSEDFIKYEGEEETSKGEPRTEGSQLILKNVSDDGRIVEYFKDGHRVALDTSKFDVKQDDLGIMSLGADDYYTVEEIIKMNPNKSYEWLMERDYHVVKPDEVPKICREIYLHDGPVGFDTETTGLNINFRSKEGYGDTLVGMVFTLKKPEGNKTYYFPVDHQLIDNIAPDGYMDHCIEKFFRPILEVKDIVCHNASFDWKVMYLYGINCNIIYDTLTLARLTIWNDDTSMPLGLKGMSMRLLGRDSLELDDFVEGKWNDNASFTDLPEESVKYYACADTDNTLDLLYYYKNNHILERYEAERVFEIEVMFSRAVGYSEYFGMYADPQDVANLSKVMEGEMAKEMSAMEGIAGREFNPRSPKQLGDVMFNQLGIEPIKYTDSGNPSADKKTLEILSTKVDAEGEPLYPFVGYLSRYRKASQLKSNFCDVFDRLSNEGFFHSSVRQFLETGRVAINEPNYQSFNDDVKKHIIPREGFYMFDTDFSSIEYRVLVSIAGEQSLIDQFFDPDFDYHRRMASLLHGIPYESVTSKLRGQSKGLNFGIPYGMTVLGLSERMFGDVSEDNVRKAQILYNKYFDVQPAVKDFFDKTKDFAVDNGYNATFFGRRRYYDKRKNKVGRIRRQAGNHPIQGTAADLYKLGIGRLFMEIFKRGHGGKILIDAFVHDEAVIECHKSINPAELMEIVSKCLMPDIKGWCPLYIGAGFGNSWYEAKSTELPVPVQTKLIETVPDGGVDFWNGDVDELVAWEKKAIRGHAQSVIVDFIDKAADKRASGDETDVLLPVAEMGYLVETLEYMAEGAIESNVDVSDHESLDLGDQLVLLGKAMGIEEKVESARISTEIPEVEDPSENIQKVDPEDIDLVDQNTTELYKARAKSMGCAIDFTNKKCYVFAVNQAWVDLVITAIEDDKKDNEGKYSLVVFTEDDVVETEHMVSSKFGSELIRWYIKK